MTTQHNGDEDKLLTADPAEDPEQPDPAEPTEQPDPDETSR